MEIKRYLAILWRWAWLIVIGVIVAGSVAFFVNKNTTPVYRASARYMIDEAPTGGNEYAQILLEQRLTQTYVQIMKTTTVLQTTIERLGLSMNPGQLSGKISISAPQDMQIIIVSVEDTDPQRAADIANTLGTVFMDQNQERENLRYAGPIATWQLRLEEVGAEIEVLDEQINRFPPAEEIEDPTELTQLQRLETQRNEARIRYTDAFNRLNALQVAQAEQSSNVVPIEEAEPRFSPIRPRTTQNTMLAAVIGGLIALGVIFLIEYLDDTVKTPDQVAIDTNLSTLGAIAVIKGDKPAERLITHYRPRDPISEAYRVLRTNLSFSAIDGGIQNILVTSSSPGEGKSTTTANLAIVIAQTGKSVLIVDSDLRRPIQHKIFGVPNNQGLTTSILDQETVIDQHVQDTKVPGLRILASGPIPPNPAELLNSQRMEHVLERLRDIYDVILYDTPPTLTVADASILAPRVDGCLLVIEAGKTRRDTFIQAVQRLQKTNAHLFGVVMNRLKPGRSGYYYDYYYYYYHYYGSYEQDNRKKSRRAGVASKLPGWLSGLSRR